MQFKFDAHQEYQIKAVKAAVNLLDGQQRISGASVFIGIEDGQTSLLPPEQRGQYVLSEILPGTIANTLNLTEDDLLINLNNVQRANGIQPDPSLALIEENIETATGQKRVRFPNFAILHHGAPTPCRERLQGVFLLRERRPLMRFPKIAGAVSITEEGGKIVIAGDPEGMRSLGQLLIWLGDADLEQWPYLPAGGRAHLHLYPKHDLLDGSREVELVRLDAKGED